MIKYVNKSEGIGKKKIIFFFLISVSFFLLLACKEQISFQKQDDGVLLKTSDGLVYVQVYDENIIHVIGTDNKKLPDKKSHIVINDAIDEVYWTVKERKDSVIIKTN